MIIIIDNFFPESIAKTIADDFLIHNKSGDMLWVDFNHQNIQGNTSPVGLVLKEASKYFDLSSLVGFEFWSNRNFKPTWHYDKDEEEFNETKKLIFPLCGIVYYPFIENLKGGRFVTETETIVPKTNRLILFSSGLYHTVEDYTGTRISISVNPWNYKLRKYYDISNTT